MRNKILFTTYSLLLSYFVVAQKKTVDFKLPEPQTKISNSIFSSIRFIDLRDDTTNFGLLSKRFVANAPVIAEPAFNVQLSDYVLKSINKTLQNGELVFVLRQLRLGYDFNPWANKPYDFGNVRFNIYSKNENNYSLIVTVDTFIKSKKFNSLDITRNLIASALSESLQINKIANAPFTYNDIINIDSLEKLKISLYTASNLKDGFYVTYKNFANQTPDTEDIIAKFRKDTILNYVEARNKKGKMRRVELTDEFYAIVYNGIAYVKTEYGYYELHKSGLEFIFKGRVKTHAPVGGAVASTIVGGSLASAIFQDASSSKFIFKIDHLDGSFIPLQSRE